MKMYAYSVSSIFMFHEVMCPFMLRMCQICDRFVLFAGTQENSSMLFEMTKVYGELT